MVECELSVEKVQDFIAFANRSDEYAVIVYLFPVPPKRKMVKLFLVKPKSFILVDHLENIDLDRLSYQFIHL